MDFFFCFPRAARKRAQKNAPRVCAGRGKPCSEEAERPDTARKKSACARISPFEASLSRTGRDCRLAARKFRAGYSFKAENHSVVAPIIKNARPFVNCSARLFFGCAARGGARPIRARSAPLSPDPSESRVRAAPARSRRASPRCPPKRCGNGSRPSRF